MGWLVGLPLGIFRVLFAVLMFVVRFAVPLLVLFVVWRIVKHYRAARRDWQEPPEKGPKFNGPVYEVDYRVVEDEQED